MAHKPADPINFVHLFWPDVYLYDKQREAMYSVADNDETYIPAGNQLGKDFVAALIVLWFFMTRHPCRVVTTSAKDDHLDVLWGEMGRFIQSAHVTHADGGPLHVTHHDIRKVIQGRECEISYIKGMVAGSDSIA